MAALVTPDAAVHDLWHRYYETHQQADRALLVEYYLPFAKKVAAKVARNAPPTVEHEDLTSMATFGLLQQIDKYDPDFGVRFEAFAMPRIYNAIIDELRSQDWAPRSLRKASRDINKTRDKLEKQLLREPSDKEIAGELETTARAISETVARAEASQMGAIDANPATAAYVRSASPQPDEVVDITTVCIEVAATIRTLPPKQQAVIALKYFRSLSIDECAVALRITATQASQLHTQAVLAVHNRIASMLTV